MQFDNRKLYRYCVAIANEGGGYLILGVTDKPPRSVVGTAAFNNPVAMAAKLFQTIGFSSGYRRGTASRWARAGLPHSLSSTRHSVSS